MSSKLSGLTAATSLVDADLLYAALSPFGSTDSRKITVANAKQALLTLVGSPTTDGTFTGPSTSSFSSGYTTVVGDCVYLDSGGLWQKADANTLALYNGLIGIAMTVAVSTTVTVALPGSFIHATAFPTFTIGSPIYMSETPGAVTHTQPVTADAAIRVLGWAVHADKMYFFPSPTYFTHV